MHIDLMRRNLNINKEQNVISKSMKWSTLGEVLAKIMVPVANMVLARLLMPEDFGILASINMIITFVDLFTDSGFAKYIIQSDFSSEKELYQYVNVAFWSNFTLSFVMWLVVVVFRDSIASIVGNPGYGNVIAVASFQLFLTSFSSIQTALFKRFFDFRTLFVSRIAAAAVPLCITIPLAFLTRNYWSLVIGSLASALIIAIILTIKSKWKPALYYNIAQLKKMLSFSIWSLAEAAAYWLTNWIDIFIIGAAFSAYYLGIYKNSLNMVNSIMALVKASVIPVLFASLSRLKSNQEEFSDVYFSIQRLASYLLIPMGVGLYVFRLFATTLLFGSKWAEASTIVGIWSLSSVFMILYSSFNGEAYKARGIPKILFVFQMVYIMFMLPVCLYFKNIGFWPLVYARGILIFAQILIGLFFMRKYIGFSVFKMICNVIPAIIPSIIMGIVGYCLRQMSDGILWQIISILICVCIYFAVLRLFFRKTISADLHVFRDKYSLKEGEIR